MAPIKRLLSTKNTTPSQKGYLFLQEQISVRRMSFSFTCSRFFFCLLCSVTLSANRHPSGSRPKSGNLKPLVRNRTPEKDRYLVKANWLLQDLGLLSGQPLRAYDKGRTKSGHSPESILLGVQRCANQAIGIFTTTIKGSPLQSQTSEQ